MMWTKRGGFMNDKETILSYVPVALSTMNVSS